MADLPITPLANYGQLLGSYGDSLANQENASTNQLNAWTSAPGKAAAAQNTQANTQLTQAQTAAANLGNTKAQIQLQWMSGMLNPPIVNDQQRPGLGSTDAAAASAPQTLAHTDGSATPTSGSGPSITVTPTIDPTSAAAGDDGSDATSVAHFGLDPAHIDSNVQRTFAVPDTWSQSEMQQLQQAQVAKAVGLPDLTDNIKLQHEANLQTRVQQAQQMASKAYDSAVAVYTAPPGRALDALKGLGSPSASQAAEGIEEIADKRQWSDAKTDAYVRQYASEMGNAVHKYSGRDVEIGKDGVARDKATNQNLLDGNPAGLSASEHAGIMQDANKLVDVPQSDGKAKQMPQWQALGYSSPVAYTNAAGARDDGTAPQAPRTPTPGRAAPVVPPSQQAAAPGAAPTQQPPLSDPVLRTALADTDFKLKTPPVVSGVTQSPADLEQAKTTVAARTDLLKDSQDATTAAASSLQYLQAAKSIMDSKGATVGAYGALVNSASKWLPFTGNVDATNYAEVAKYLGNSALAQAKGTYGAKMTQSEVQLSLNELSPSVHMPDKAISNLLNTNIAASKYAIDSANRVQKYLASNGDPQQFSTWNQKYFPKADVVNSDGKNTSTSTTTPSTTTGGLTRITSAQQLSGLQKGTRFMGPDGKIRVKN